MTARTGFLLVFSHLFHNGCLHTIWIIVLLLLRRFHVSHLLLLLVLHVRILLIVPVIVCRVQILLLLLVLTIWIHTKLRWRLNVPLILLRELELPASTSWRHHGLNGRQGVVHGRHHCGGRHHCAIVECLVSTESSHIIRIIGSCPLTSSHTKLMHSGLRHRSIHGRYHLRWNPLATIRVKVSGTC